jgi:hypothetical protein
MNDYTGPPTLLDVHNTRFTSIDMLNKKDIGPITPNKDWLVPWQEGHKDKNGNNAPTPISTLLF